MKEKIFINARIIDPSQKMDEKGSLILDKNGKVKAIGKNVKKTDVIFWRCNAKYPVTIIPPATTPKDSLNRRLKTIPRPMAM